ncbi:hypothetical protein J3D49_001697 [Pseudomonas kilonensis]|jgi:hypothetical protein|nr:hypothetical protein [Pseudomonas kilonensis]
MQCEGAPNVFGIRRRDGILLQLEPGGGDVLEGVFCFCSFGFLQLIALSFWVDALCKQLSSLNVFFLACARETWG